MQLKKISVILLLFWQYILDSQAAEFCATNSTELTNALSSAENNNQHDVIKIAVGNYEGGFTFTGGEGYDLSISGGWSDFFGNPCGQQINPPFDTILDGDNSQKVLDIIAHDDNDITISNLTLINGNALPGSAGGLELFGWTGYVGDVIIEKVAFINNKGNFHSALSVSRGRKITVRNSIFAINENTTGDGTVDLNNSELGIYFNNNTLVNNTSVATDSSVHSGLRANFHDGAGIFVANNLFWNNDGHDAYFGGVNMTTTESYLYNNNINSYIGTIHNIENNFTAEPIFENGFLNYTPTIASPEINQGRQSPFFVPVPPPFNMQWGVGITDFEGNTRVQDGRVDVGAIEAEPEEPIFKNGFEIIL
ncbi:MAG: hypothetical protein KDI92_01555 [Xanthomonadales bacterium]|nr:hypothetical protein [Xanthomonadales bacterium]